MQATKHQLGPYTFFALRESNVRSPDVREWLVTLCVPEDKKLPAKPGAAVRDEYSGATVVKKYGRITVDPSTGRWHWELTPGGGSGSHKGTNSRKALMSCLDALEFDRQSQVVIAHEITQKRHDMETVLNDHATPDSRCFSEVEF